MKYSKAHQSKGQVCLSSLHVVPRMAEHRTHPQASQFCPSRPQARLFFLIRRGFAVYSRKADSKLPTPFSPANFPRGSSSLRQRPATVHIKSPGLMNPPFPPLQSPSTWQLLRFISCMGSKAHTPQLLRQKITTTTTGHFSSASPGRGMAAHDPGHKSTLLLIMFAWVKPRFLTWHRKEWHLLCLGLKIFFLLHADAQTSFPGEMCYLHPPQPFTGLFQWSHTVLSKHRTSSNLEPYFRIYYCFDYNLVQFSRVLLCRLESFSWFQSSF